MSEVDPAVQEVLEQLREMRSEMGEFRRDTTRDITQCRVDIATLKTKSKIWGGLVGLFGGGAGAGLAKLFAALSEPLTK